MVHILFASEQRVRRHNIPRQPHVSGVAELGSHAWAPHPWTWAGRVGGGLDGRQHRFCAICRFWSCEQTFSAMWAEEQ